MTTEQQEQNPIPFRQALVYWLKLGFISFGGPAGQISMMHQELVEKRRWISEHRFLHALNYTMVLPGPEAQQLATYIGWLMHGTIGGIIAGTLFVLPSLLILIALSWLYLVYGDVQAIAGIFYGIKPAVIAIVLFAAYRIGSRALKNFVLWLLALAAFVSIFFLQVPFPYIVVGALLLGAGLGRFFPQYFRAGGGHGASHKDYGPAIIDDDTPTPEHARFCVRRMLTVIILGFGLWVLSMYLLLLAFDDNSTPANMGWFFTKAALVTFGGAYAVLPYVYQGGVETFQWLSATQMIDGLALGETTPGPLIMVVAFVGFLGGWQHAVLGGDALLYGGMLGAGIATFYTFLPSFLFILVGAPLVEASRENLKLTAPLSAVTAAVVGVILNLALFFCYHVLWPRGFEQEFEYPAAAIGIIACVALFRLKMGIPSLLALCGGLGLAYTLLAA